MITADRKSLRYSKSFDHQSLKISSFYSITDFWFRIFHTQTFKSNEQEEHLKQSVTEDFHMHLDFTYWILLWHPFWFCWHSFVYNLQLQFQTQLCAHFWSNMLTPSPRFVWNTGTHLLNYMASHPRRPYLNIHHCDNLKYVFNIFKILSINHTIPT